MRRWIGLLFVLSSLVPPALAQAPPKPACTNPEYRQFDFWLGDWNVYDPAGKLAGTNRVTLELGRCVLHEHWNGTRGSVGESFNAYDQPRGRWHQTWVDNGGTVLSLEGGLHGRDMVLQGTTPDSAAQDGQAIQRITWSPLDSGDVRQHWEASKDGGATWTTAFDGRYVRKERDGRQR